VASVTALQINRARCRGSFLEVMDDMSQELHEFSVALFNKFGHLKPELVEHEYHRGSGCWGREMDNNMLVYIESVEVKPQFRNKGVGSWALRKLSERFATHADFVVCWPTPIERILEKSAWEAQKNKIIDFFRKNDFRRVGRTDFFAYSPNPQHPSRSLAATDDVAGHEYATDESEDPATEARHQERYPVHHAIAKSLHPGGGAPIGDTIRTAYSVDHASVRKKDDNGISPLHLAAGLLSLPAVEALLALPEESGVREDLTLRDNKDGVTPFEACEHMMRSTKEFSETMLGVWNGHQDEGLKIAATLRRAAGEQVGTDDEYIRQRKWGCTCGQCADGWLSPRMRYRLECAAELDKDMMETMRPQFRRGRPLSLLTILGDSIALNYVPQYLWGVIDRAFYDGLQLVFQEIADVLKQGAIPSPQHVRQRVEAVAQRFFAEDGRVEYALDFVTQGALEQSPLGDATWDEMVEDDLAERHDGVWEAWRSLPQCANDLEFGMVRERLG
ncbi:hypothetical protein BKA93DRAFT_718300, partial [Sparassis latifolia]